MILAEKRTFFCPPVALDEGNAEKVKADGREALAHGGGVVPVFLGRPNDFNALTRVARRGAAPRYRPGGRPLVWVTSCNRVQTGGCPGRSPSRGATGPGPCDERRAQQTALVEAEVMDQKLVVGLKRGAPSGPATRWSRLACS